ncbi:hypothetical protein H6G64_08355 [Calothrix sp. FACHB-156]|nr:hypothetical protein [Calothrix sp. FACHB-156]
MRKTKIDGLSTDELEAGKTLFKKGNLSAKGFSSGFQIGCELASVAIIPSEVKGTLFLKLSSDSQVFFAINMITIYATISKNINQIFLVDEYTINIDKVNKDKIETNNLFLSKILFMDLFIIIIIKFNNVSKSYLLFS